LSDVEAAPDTKPVVYSPVPTIRTAGGAIASARLKYVGVRTQLQRSHVNIVFWMLKTGQPMFMKVQTIRKSVMRKVVEKLTI
jgi:hypothetical protein